MYLWWCLSTLHLHACHVSVTVGDSGLCCTCITLCVDYEEEEKKTPKNVAILRYSGMLFSMRYYFVSQFSFPHSKPFVHRSLIKDYLSAENIARRYTRLLLLTLKIMTAFESDRPLNNHAVKCFCMFQIGLSWKVTMRSLMILILACVAAVGKFIVIGEQGEFCFTLFLFVLLSLPLSSPLSPVSIHLCYPSLSLSFHLSLSLPLSPRLPSTPSSLSLAPLSHSVTMQWLKTKQAGKLQPHSVYSIVNTWSIAKVMLERTLISSGHKWIWLLTEHVTLAYWKANVQKETEWT